MPRRRALVRRAAHREIVLRELAATTAPVRRELAPAAPRAAHAQMVPADASDGASVELDSGGTSVLMGVDVMTCTGRV